MDTDKKKILLSDEKSTAKLIEQAWQSFKKEAEENGLVKRKDIIMRVSGLMVGDWY